MRGASYAPTSRGGHDRFAAGCSRPCAAACGGDDDDDSASNTTASGGSAGGDCVVGVSWNNYQEERWAKCDEPAIKEAVEAGGGTYISNDAKSSAETQASNVENLISQGANVLDHPRPGRHRHQAVGGQRDRRTACRSSPTTASSRTRARSTSRSTTSRSAGCRPQAIFDAVPKGNYVIIKGNKADANADFLRARLRGGHR